MRRRLRGPRPRADRRRADLLRRHRRRPAAGAGVRADRPADLAGAGDRAGRPAGRAAARPSWARRTPSRGWWRPGSGWRLLGGLLALLPMSLYGEGLRRALLRFGGRREGLTGWRGRLAALPVLLLAPVLLYPLLLTVPVMADLAEDGGAGATSAGRGRLLRACWPRSPCRWPGGSGWSAAGRVRWTALVVGALFTAACLSGFLQGFVLFLALPLDLGAPFGGLAVVGGVVAVGPVAVPAAPGGARAAGCSRSRSTSCSPAVSRRPAAGRPSRHRRALGPARVGRGCRQPRLPPGSGGVGRRASGGGARRRGRRRRRRLGLGHVVRPVADQDRAPAARAPPGRRAAGWCRPARPSAWSLSTRTVVLSEAGRGQDAAAVG